MEREMDAELRFHLEARAEDLMRAGLPYAEAMRRARIEFGGMDQAKEECRKAKRVGFAENLIQDLRFGGRLLRKNPGFALVVVVTLMLGIGANSAVFSFVSAVILRPLPVARPSELFFLENPRYGAGQSFPNYRDLRERNHSFADLVGYRMAPMEMETNGGAQRIWGYLATGNYFDVLGVKPVLGRLLTQSDDLSPGASPYAVLSYGTWRSRFSSDSTIVGKTIRLNRMPYTVLGVAPPDFHGTEVFYRPEVWVPMMMEPRIESNAWLEERNSWNVWVLGRLRPGVSQAQAEDDLNAVGSEMAREFPDVNDGLAFKLSKPGLVGNLIGGPAKAFLFGILTLAALVLLAACTNLAGLFAAKATDRQREVAIRVAMGSSRARIIRQVLTEGWMLATAGGAAGYLLAVVIAKAWSGWRAPMDFPIQFSANPDWRVFLFALGSTTTAAALFAIAPAWRACKTEPNSALRGGSGTGSEGRLAVRELLVVAQVALCFVLVSAAFLSLRGLQRALELNLGFEPQRVVTAAFDLNLAGYSAERGRALQRQALQTIRQLPGVESAAYSNSVPLSIDQSHTGVFSADKTDLRPSDRVSVAYYQVSPGFFQTMGTRLLAGREFSWQDDAKSPQVAIVNLAFAKQVLHVEDAVGKRFRGGALGPFTEIVGVVEDGKYEKLTESEQPVVFWSILQSYNSTTTVEVKSSLPEAQVTAEIRQAMRRLDPELPLYGMGNLEQMLGFAFFPTRAAAIALSAFGLLAVMLAATGVHGLVAYAVAKRSHEVGIRVALGARPAELVRLLVGKTTILIALGSIVGLGLALALGQLMSSIVYETQPRDPMVMLSAWAGIGLLGLLASWAPVKRALQADPTVALRCE